MRTITVVLGGGQGSRLYPLTVQRAKPAVPLAGKYRLIDIPISNAINSGLRQIFVLTQFNSASLNAHISKTYRFDAFSSGFVEVLAAEQTEASLDWYQGTADAVRKHLHRFARPDVDHVIILSGDHLYRMDYRLLLERHVASGAGATVCTMPVTRAECTGLGVLACDDEGRIRRFKEKPRPDEDISDLEVPGELARANALGDRTFLASMGIYVFRRDVLTEVLAGDSVDFGKHVLPAAIHDYRVMSYLFQDYWEDIGTISAFFETNLALCTPDPRFVFYKQGAPIYTRARFLPSSKVFESDLKNALISDGCIINGATVDRAVIGLRSRVQRGARLKDVVMMGADFYEDDAQRDAVSAAGGVPVGVGPGAVVERAIIDKNARIGAGAVLRGWAGRPDEDHGRWVVRDGILIVTKGAVIEPGTVI
jgi:glucose-1-phosphate adenylyltransferase